MLLIQHITLLWLKECRGAPYSSLRSKMPKAYELPENFYDYKPQAFPSHTLYIHQEKSGLIEKTNRIDTIGEEKNIRVGAIEIFQQADYYEFWYQYEFDQSIPERHKYNPKTSIHEYLVETALQLRSGEYGRISYNGRHVDADTGEWNYQWHIINVMHAPDARAPLDVFTKKEPDKEYKQMVILR